MSQNPQQPRQPQAQNRDPREAQNRELETRDSFARPETWAPPTHLPEPIPQEGYVYRWIRTATMGIDDAMNVNAKYREGFSPVSAAEQPHIATMVDPHSRYAGMIENGGLLLCKAPVEFMKKRESYYSNMTKQAQVAVDNNLMKENDARMPLFKEGKSKVTFGGGSAA